MSHCSDMIMSEGGSSLSGSFHTDERRGDPLLLWFGMNRWVWRCQCYYGKMRRIEWLRRKEKGESSPSITVLWCSLDSRRQTETQTHFSFPADAHTHTHIQAQWRSCEITFNSTTWPCIKFFFFFFCEISSLPESMQPESVVHVYTVCAERSVSVALLQVWGHLFCLFFSQDTAGIAGERENRLNTFSPSSQINVCAITSTIWCA